MHTVSWSSVLVVFPAVLKTLCGLLGNQESDVGVGLRVKVPPSVWAKTTHHSGLKLAQDMCGYMFRMYLNGVLF